MKLPTVKRNTIACSISTFVYCCWNFASFPAASYTTLTASPACSLPKNPKYTQFVITNPHAFVLVDDMSEISEPFHQTIMNHVYIYIYIYIYTSRTYTANQDNYSLWQSNRVIRMMHTYTKDFYDVLDICNK